MLPKYIVLTAPPYSRCFIQQLKLSVVGSILDATSVSGTKKCTRSS
jgi:hypothetical protein